MVTTYVSYIENWTSLRSNQVPTQTEIQSENTSQPKVEQTAWAGIVRKQHGRTGQGRLGLGLG
jgi:hypothetical protein